MCQDIRLRRLFQYTDPSERNSQCVWVIQLKSTPSAKVKRSSSSFQAGACCANLFVVGASGVEILVIGKTHASGLVTFKFLIRHTNWMNSLPYVDTIDVLKSQIKSTPYILRYVYHFPCR